jgi:hypothetical protein
MQVKAAPISIPQPPAHAAGSGRPSTHTAEDPPAAAPTEDTNPPAPNERALGAPAHQARSIRAAGLTPDSLIEPKSFGQLVAAIAKGDISPAPADTDETDGTASPALTEQEDLSTDAAAILAQALEEARDEDEPNAS